jgi:hypothetical protein
LEVFTIKDIVYSNDQENHKIVPLACMVSKSIRIETFKPQKFRNTFSTNHIQKGVPMELIVKQLGHIGINNKLKIYAVNDNVMMVKLPELMEDNVSDSDATNLQRTFATNLNIGIPLQSISQTMGTLPCSIETTKRYFKMFSNVPSTLSISLST